MSTSPQADLPAPQASPGYFARNRLWLMPLGNALVAVLTLAVVFGLFDDGTTPVPIVALVERIGTLLVKLGAVLMLGWSGFGAMATDTVSARIYRAALTIGSTAFVAWVLYKHFGH